MYSCIVWEMDLCPSLIHHKPSSEDIACLPRWLIRLLQKCFKVLTGFAKSLSSHEFRILYYYYLINLHSILGKKTTGIITALHMEQQIIERSTTLSGLIVTQWWNWANVEVQRELSVCTKIRLSVLPSLIWGNSSRRLLVCILIAHTHF